MNYITLAMVSLTVIPILFGVLLGLLRGSRRALLRLILVVVSVALAFALTGVVSGGVMSIEIGDSNGNLAEFMQQDLLGDMPQSMAEFVVPLAQSIIQIVVFLLLFFVLLLLTWAIVYPLCKLFVKPKRVMDADGNVTGTKKRRLIGMVFGAVQGVIVALVVGVVMSALLVQTGNVVAAVGEITERIDEAIESEMPSEEGVSSMFDDVVDMFSEYADSGIAKMYDAIGSKPFAFISRVKLDDGTTVTLPGQVEAVQGLVKIADKLADLREVDYDHMFTSENMQILDGIFTELDNIKDGMSDEAKTTVNKLMTSLSNEMGLADINGKNITDINFKKEGEIFTRLEAYNQKDSSELTEEDAEQIINDLVQSDLILNVLQQQNDVDINSQFNDDEHREMITEIINGLEVDEENNVTQEKIDALRKIFGLDKNIEATE